MSGFFELIIDIFIDDAGLAYRLITQEDDFYFYLAGYCADGVIHQLSISIKLSEIGLLIRKINYTWPLVLKRLDFDIDRGQGL